MINQTTLGGEVSVNGIGIHSGLEISLTLRPAAASAGIVFRRLPNEEGPSSRVFRRLGDEEGSSSREVGATISSVIATEFATVLGDRSGPLVSSIEHVLAALRGLRVDNAVIELNGPEVPAMDGSAADFVAAIDKVGIVPLEGPRRAIKILKPVRVKANGSFGELSPLPEGFRVDIEIEFSNQMIGRQTFECEVGPETFRRELSRARTFGFMKDVARLWAAGYAMGSSFENTLVVSDDKILNPEGLRFPNEFARHKAVDAIGDMSLSGFGLIGSYRSVRGGHKLNCAVLSALMADHTAWKIGLSGKSG